MLKVYCVTLRLLGRGRFSRFCPFRCLFIGKPMLSSMVIVVGLYTVCLGLFAIPLGVIGSLRSVFMACPRHLLFN